MGFPLTVGRRLCSTCSREIPLRLELRGITKRFGDLVANDHIDLTVEPGEVHALLGENGAGKSTLMNQLYGLLQPDEGQILVDGEPRTFRSPRDAIAAGIGMVHQHFMLVPVFTVMENIALGAEETQGGPLGWLDRRRSRRDVLETSERYGLPVDPDALVENLPVGAQQRVEIVKALTRDVDLLILDEPTAVLTPQEARELLAVMRSLSDTGKSRAHGRAVRPPQRPGPDRGHLHPGHPGGRAGLADGRPLGQPRGGEDPGRAGPRGPEDLRPDGRRRSGHPRSGRGGPGGPGR